MPNEFIVVIPARYASSRLPGKIIAPIAGKPMVQHVFERAAKSEASRVVVAADDQKIVDALSEYDTDVVMTSADHQSGTDRLQEVAAQLSLSDDAIIVNVQGDEPLIPPAVINQVATNLAQDQSAEAATLCEAITAAEDFVNPNVVKVVFGENGHAHYFSRSPIPYPRDDMANLTSPACLPARCFRHIGIYGYRVKLLNDFVSWPMAPLENIEKLEQLRILHNGGAIHVDVACQPVPGGVDTQMDLARVRQRFEGDSVG
ncbi:3-deoxy-manno-octulosonate cytidylyltransferase [Aurantivibrio plasticivorans]